MLRTLLLTMTLAVPALAFEVRTDSQGDVVRWDKKVEFVVSPDLAQQLRLPGAMSAVNGAVAAMAAKTAGLEVKARLGNQPAQLGYSVGGANQNDVVLLEDWPYESSNLAATLVTLNARTNLILDADIALNGESAGFVIVDGKPGEGETKYDLQNTLTHELGHALGLMHNQNDETSVMYPSAAPGEICKRTLGQDDIAALEELYPPVAEPEAAEPVPGVGCSSVPAPVPLAVLLVLVLLAGSRRRRLAVLAVSASAALAAEPAKVEREPDEIAWGEVVETSSRWLPETRLIVTEVEVEVQRCVKGACAEHRVKLQVLGGRVGELEQVVTHQPPPRRGSQVVLTKRGGHLRLTIAR